MTQVVGRPAVTRRRQTKTSYSSIWRELEDDDVGTNRPRDGQLGVPPSKAGLEEGQNWARRPDWRQKRELALRFEAGFARFRHRRTSFLD